MNWDAIGATGEMLGAGVVAVTLLFLIHQIRQNTNSVRTQTMFNIIHEANAINSMIVHDANAARIFDIGQNRPDDLKPEEQVQSQALIRPIINLAHAGYIALGYDAIPDRLWESLRASAGDVAMTEGGRRFLSANIEYFGEEFANEIAPPGESVIFDRTGWHRSGS